MQSRSRSFNEVCISTALGLILAFVAQHYLFQIYGIQASNVQNMWVVFWMTVISIARGYLVRRWFNRGDQ